MTATIFSDDDNTTMLEAAEAIGSVPEWDEPDVHVVTITRRGSGWGYRCSCGYAPNVSSKMRRVAVHRAKVHTDDANRGTVGA